MFGDWLMCKDEDGNARDEMVLHPEGYGFVINAKGTKSPFIYTLERGKLLLLVNADWTFIPVQFDYAPEKGEISLYSPNTGNRSYYVRRDALVGAGCGKSE